MSLKPKKASEIKREKQELQAKMMRKKKALLDDLPPYMFIVSEGTKTDNFSVVKSYCNFHSLIL